VAERRHGVGRAGDHVEDRAHLRLLQARVERA
jgi:hypothetical protein